MTKNQGVEMVGDDNVEAPKQGPNSIVAKNAETVVKSTTIISFRNRPMLLEHSPYPHYVPLRKERFEQVAYPLLGGVSRSRMGDVFAYIANTAEDLTDHDRYVLFGTEAPTDEQLLAPGLPAAPVVWDMADLRLVRDIKPQSCIWRSPYPQAEASERLPFIMSLAGNDKDLYDDIMQSMAPLIMEKKPDGVIWWVGDGANGKSTLMDAIYRIFPGQLSSLTVKRLTDQRDTPSLNGTLANVVKESSEGRIDDTEIYKAIGTHENFRVHKFHSQDDIEIRGNVHHIFSGNSIPTFNDKGHSARRRTYIIPFTQVFESDPTFEEKTFTPEFFGQLISEMCKYAVKLREQGYKYKWSAATLNAKAEYDTEANNAEEYARHLVSIGVVGFDTYHQIRMDYENWCADEGYVPLGVTNMRRAVGNLYQRISVRHKDNVSKIYVINTMTNDHGFMAYGMGRPGLYTMSGFQREPEPEEPKKEEPEQTELPTILGGEW